MVYCKHNYELKSTRIYNRFVKITRDFVMHDNYI